jgi:hypothetical protein
MGVTKMELIQVQEKNKKEEIEDMRKHPRYPTSLTVNFETSSSLTMQKSHQAEADGNTHDLSAGGLCLITDQALEKSQIIKIRIPIPNVSATMPTLAEVRWVKKQPIQSPPAAQPISRQTGGQRYIAGLRFLF